VFRDRLTHRVGFATYPHSTSSALMSAMCQQRTLGAFDVLLARSGSNIDTAAKSAAEQERRYIRSRGMRRVQLREKMRAFPS
jgi:hypothetical protein